MFTLFLQNTKKIVPSDTNTIITSRPKYTIEIKSEATIADGQHPKSWTYFWMCWYVILCCHPISCFSQLGNSRSILGTTFDAVLKKLLRKIGLITVLEINLRKNSTMCCNFTNFDNSFEIIVVHVNHMRLPYSLSDLNLAL